MTISEIAKLAGVSSAAVSRYMNKGSLSEEKKKRIQQVIEKTGYVPSYSARMLRTNKSYQIGVIVPKIHSSSVSKVITGINKTLIENKYHMFLASTENHFEREKEYLEAFKNMPIDGVILLGTIMTEEYEKILEKFEKPIVVVGQYVSKCNCVYNDDENAAYNVAKLLTENGCKKLGYISVLQEDKATGEKRTEGLFKAAKEYGINVNDITVVESGFKVDDGYHAMKKLLDMTKDIDGVFCATDSLAIGAVSAIKERGLKCPQQISVCGVGDNYISSVIEPKITTAKYFYEQSGKEAVKILLSTIEKEEKAPLHQIKFGYEIIERESIKIKSPKSNS